MKREKNILFILTILLLLACTACDRSARHVTEHLSQAEELIWAAPDSALHILESLKLIPFAESLGGVETLITYPTTQTHEDTPADIKEKLGITDCFLRMSVGIENIDDLLEDLEQAFA